MSSQPDARKRRSFLPAPKRSSGLSPTSPQSSTSHPLSGLPQPTSSSSSHHSASSSSSTSSAYPSSSSSLAPPQPGDPRDPRDPRSHSADSKRRDKKPDNSAPVFGKGLRVGARIKIGGVKPGILRYLGTTHLAPGIFCGIELFDPDGCHDGEVNGHRYFSCSPKHGIFAPKERVCLDSSACALGRVTSDSDNSYSSTESLSERSNKAFQDYAEGELEAIDYSTLSPESSFHEALQGNREAGSRRGVGGQRSLLPPQPSKLASLSTTYDVIDLDQSADSGSEYAHRAASRDLAEAPQKRYKSALPKATRSSGIPTAPTSKLPTFSSTSSVSSSSTSRSYAKHDEQGPTLQYRGPPAPPRGEPGRDESRVPADAHAKTFTHSSASESDRESDRASPRFRIATTRSSDDSEEDSFVWDALSRGIKKQLRADSRQYLNFTFDPEEQNRSVDREDSESDSNSRDPSADRKHAARVYPPYSDPKFIKYIAKNVSDDSLGIISTDVVGDTSPREVADGGRRSLRGDELHQLRTSTPVTSRPGSGEVRTSDSYTIFREDQHTSHSSDMSQDSSGLDEDGSGHLHQRHHHHHHHQHRRLSATRSISDSDLPPELIPRHSDEGTERYPPPPPMYDSHEEDERLSEGGYGNEGNKGEGTSASFGLNPSRKLDSRKCESYKGAPPRHEADVGASRSYTLASHELVEEIPCRKDSSYTVCTSQSYTIAKSDSVTSSPSRKSRKVSTGSSVNGEPPGSGDSSSSGTDPKTDSSGEKKGDTMDDSSSGPSPEVSQALEWDYDQDFDGKNPLSRQDNTMTTSASTGTSESLSDVLRDGSDNSDGLGEAEMPSMEDSDSQFEAPDNEFENIDSLEDFPIFGKDAKTLMTDSGISDYSTTKSSSSTVCGNSSDECSREDDASSLRTTRAVSSDSSQETLAAEFVPDTPGSVEEKDLPGDEDRDPGEEEEYEGEDGEGAAGGFVSRRGARVMDVRDELERERKDSIDDGNSTSPASVVSVEEVSAIQDRTLLVDEVTSGLSIVHAGERSKVKDFHSPGSDTSLSDEVPDESLDTDRSLGFDDVTVLEKSSSDLPRAGSEDTGDEDMNDESRDHTAGRKQRPVSLISTTSADTGTDP
ncbi:uncharacterized protein LOC101864037 isoform X2 [Aplysia californica]|uniref:Uncharacterized protein LOC101864037 isoform X2 n=1 Tax=Aplysia californica TaxID=6500 RepID=A0ABM1W3J6_APLCA|nr:uncharacterized protein LOC101864037 isoform X2 [Aplysia californica]